MYVIRKIKYFIKKYYNLPVKTIKQQNINFYMCVYNKCYLDNESWFVQTSFIMCHFNNK